MLKVCEPEVNSSGKRKDKYRCYNVKLNNRTFKDVPAKYKNKCSDCEEKNSCVYNMVFLFLCMIAKIIEFLSMN